jgi:NAD(P)-dependent dehydrogenase (short-subunit alcohol dehydrogenase family)
LEADGERLPCRLRRPARRFHRGIDLRQRQAGMVEKGLARNGQLHAAGTAAQQFDPDLVFQIPNLPAQRRLRSAQPSFGRQGSGSIINISSTYGHEGAAGASVYVGSKHAVEGITKSVALEVAKSGIRVNGVAPGPTDTGKLSLRSDARPLSTASHVGLSATARGNLNDPGCVKTRGSM